MLTDWVHHIEKVSLGLNNEHEYIQDVYTKRYSESLVASVIVRDYNPRKVYAATENFFKVFDNVDDAIYWVEQVISGEIDTGAKIIS